MAGDKMDADVEHIRTHEQPNLHEWEQPYYEKRSLSNKNNGETQFFEDPYKDRDAMLYKSTSTVKLEKYKENTEMTLNEQLKWFQTFRSHGNQK